MRNSKLFKLRYTYIDICKDATGTLRSLELGGGIGQNSPFIHTCKSLRLDRHEADLMQKQSTAPNSPCLTSNIPNSATSPPSASPFWKSRPSKAPARSLPPSSHILLRTGRVSTFLCLDSLDLPDADIQQTACSSRSSSWPQNSFLSPASPKQNPKAAGRNASARIYGSSADTTGNRSCCFSPTRSARS